jgi:homoaconitate hydratase
MPRNLIELIAQRHAVGLEPGQVPRSGDIISIRPAHVMTHDNTGAVIPKFRSIGARRLADPGQVVVALDHNIQDRSPENLAKYDRIEAFAREAGAAFYPAGRGIGHQIMIEEGYAWPGTLVVASDSHSNMYGGVGCLGTPVVRTDAAAIWATGRTWWQVPPVARVELLGRLRPGVSGKDVILTLCSVFHRDEVLNHAVEFCGEGVAGLPVDERLAIANMTTEWGALAGVFPVDDTLIDWLRRRAETLARRGDAPHPRLQGARIEALAADPPRAEAGAGCALHIRLDLDRVSPWVAGPNAIKRARPAAELALQRLPIQKAYLVSCVNSRASDLAAAAGQLRGRHIAPGVEFYISAASSEVQAQSASQGDWQVLIDAGARELPPGCGPCIGLGTGLLEAGERGISATNRNFKGRMGHPDSEAWLASPAVVAASALAGVIAVPEGAAEALEPGAHIERPGPLPRPETALRLLEGFPECIEGELVYCAADNLNTDGIYAGKWTYRDDMGPAEQASVVMENHDPAFREIARDGDLLVGGFNFGTGSSREQAATAFKHFGIRILLGGSFSETYKRNALNNGLLALEAPELSRALRETFGDTAPTLRTGWTARFDVRRSLITAGGRDWPVAPVGVAAQELILAGGLEAWVRQQLSDES